MESRIKEIAALLNKASDAYYNTGNEIMSNKEYDALYDELVKLESESGIILSDSPTQRVGYEVVSELKKERHEFPALSLDKTKDINEFPLIFNTRDKIAVVMWKMDGSTLQVTYDNGRLIKAVTRGNGEVGSNVTHNVPYIKGLPMTIPCKGHVVVRGEVVMTYSEFERINQELPPEEQYKNPRNLANATVSMLDSREMRKRELWFYGFKLVYSDQRMTPETFASQMLFMANQGINLVEFDIPMVDDLVPTMNEFSDRVGELDYPVDGLVVAANDVVYAESLPGTGHNPNKLVGYAFKWQDETAETTLLRIEWSASRTGLLNPVAVFEPVELEGTTVTRASLSNVSNVKRLQLRPGNRITVYKANKIIPQVDKNLDMDGVLTYAESHPVKCPCCGKETSPLISKDDVEVAVCNNPECSAKNIKKFVHFASRDCMNITGFSDATIERFVEAGIITEYADFFTLGFFKDEIISMDGLGEKSFQNLAAAAEKARHTSFVPFVTSLGILGIGKGQSKILSKEFHGDIMEFLRAASNRRFFSSIEGIGEVLEDNIWRWANQYLQWIDFNDDTPREKVHGVNWEIANLLKQVDYIAEETTSGSKLSGITFVITGSLNHYANRDALISVIEQNGGKVSGSVSAKTTYLINNDVESTSGKNKKAKELGVKIISEEDFMNLLV